MKPVRVILVSIFLVVIAYGQNAIPSYLPHPYIAGGFSLMPNGYSPVAYRIQGGIYEDYKHLVSDMNVAYDNGRKSNDGTMTNIHGHDEYLSGFLAFRPKNWYYGLGASWNKLVTTNYTKGSNLLESAKNGDFRLKTVTGRDWFRKDFSVRGQIEYLFPPFHESVSYPAILPAKPIVCQGCGNGVQGTALTMIFPSPSIANRHWFFQETIGIYEFHTTVTEPCPGPFCNPPDFESQRHDRHAMATSDFMIVYQF